MIQDTSSQDTVLEDKTKQYSPKMIFAAAIMSVGILFFLFQGVSNWLSVDRSVDRERVTIAQVERGEFTRDVSLQGVIVAANSPKLYAPAVGNITLHINPGQAVEKDSLVATVDSPELTNRLQQEQAKLESLGIELQRKKINAKQSHITSRQNIALEKVVLNAAKREQRRANASIKINAISQIDFEKAEDDLKRSELKHNFSIEQAKLESESLAFEIKTAEFEFNQYQLLVENTERLVKSLNIVAPVSGIVGSWSVEQKSAVVLNQPLLTIVDLSNFQVEVEIPESYSDKLGIGMVAMVNYNGKNYDAKIVTISPEVLNNTVKGRVAFSTKPPPGIKQNQQVTSRVILEHKKNVLFLPRGSFTQHYSGRKAFVVNENVATLRDIEIGSSSIKKIEILSGLKEGDRVIVSNTDFVDSAEILNIN